MKNSFTIPGERIPASVHVVEKARDFFRLRAEAITTRAATQSELLAAFSQAERGEYLARVNVVKRVARRFADSRAKAATQGATEADATAAAADRDALFAAWKHVLNPFRLRADAADADFLADRVFNLLAYDRDRAEVGATVTTTRIDAPKEVSDAAFRAVCERVIGWHLLEMSISDRAKTAAAKADAIDAEKEAEAAKKAEEVAARAAAKKAKADAAEAKKKAEEEAKAAKKAKADAKKAAPKKEKAA